MISLVYILGFSTIILFYLWGSQISITKKYKELYNKESKTKEWWMHLYSKHVKDKYEKSR